MKSWFTTIILALISTNSFAAGDANHGEDKAYRNYLPPKKAQSAKAKAPAQVSLISPNAFEVIKATEAQLTWQPSPTADSYHLQVATDPNFKWLVLNVTDVKETNYKATQLPAGQVFWRVAAQKSGNMPAHWKSIFQASSFEVTAE